MPRVPKLTWGPNRKDHFRDWIHYELTQTIADRAALDRKWADEIVQWRASLPKGEKDFPFPGASNLEFPLTAIHSDPVYADMMQTLHAPEDYWSTSPKRPDRTQHANPIREFLTALDKNYLHMRPVNGKGILDKVVHGTAIYKNHWTHERRPYYVNEDGQLAKRNRIKSAPKIEVVPLQHFYIPASAWDIDPDAPVGGARWVGQKFYLTREQLIQRSRSDNAFLPDYDRMATDIVARMLEDRADDVDDAIRRQEQFQPFHNERIELWEIHARFDADGDGVEEDIVCVFHRDTMQILRAVFQPFMHGKRPFHRVQYLPTFGFYGMGMAELNEWSQVTLTRLLNATVDNVLVANTRMYTAPLGSSLRPGEPVYPGRVITTQPGEGNSIKELRLGEIYPSLPNLQQFIMQVAEMRTGVSELRQGNITNLPGRTPATTVMGALQQSSKRFALVMANFRDVHSEMGLRMLQNVAQFYDDDPITWTNFCTDALGRDDAQKVIEVLQGGSDEIEASFGVAVSATNELVNKEAEKQSFIGLLQITTQVYGQLVQTAMMLQQVPPGTPAYDTAAAAYSGGVELIGRLLERFDIQNPSQYLGNMSAIAGALTGQQQGMNAAMMPPGGGMQVPMSPFPMEIGPDPLTAGVFGL